MIFIGRLILIRLIDNVGPYIFDVLTQFVIGKLAFKGVSTRH